MDGTSFGFSVTGKQIYAKTGAKPESLVFTLKQRKRT
jgi:hypothetical protein